MKKEENSDSDCDSLESSDDNFEEDEIILNKESSSDADVDETDCINIEDLDELTLTGQVLTLWKAYCPKLLHVISCITYLLSPDPVVQNHV